MRRSGRRLGLRRLLQPPRHPDRRLGIRRRSGRVPLAVRRLRVDVAVRRLRASRITPRRRASARRWCCASPTPTSLPYDYVEFARTMQRYLPAIERQIASRGWTASTAALRAAIERMEHEAAAFAAARDSVARAGTLARRRRARGERRAARGRARAHAPGGAAHAALVPQPHLRRRREQRLREHGVPVGERGDPRRMTMRLAARELADLAQRFDAATRALTQRVRHLPHPDRVHIEPAGSARRTGRTRLRLSSRQFSGLPIASPRKPERDGRLAVVIRDESTGLADRAPVRDRADRTAGLRGTSGVARWLSDLRARRERRRGVHRRARARRAAQPRACGPRVRAVGRDAR